MEDVYQEVTLSREQPHIDLAKIDMKLAPLARLYGKPAPDWNITEARGIEQEAKISDYKGKWLLLEFWGYWCGPCVRESLPGLVQLYEQLESARDKFEIIAIHHQGASSLKELDEKLQPVIEKVWLGKSLPFPIIVDAEDKTVDSYGVDSFPTAVLVDPEGRVVRQGSASMLKGILQGRNTPSNQPVEVFLDGPAKPQPPLASRKVREHIKTDEHIPLIGHTDIVSSVTFSPDGRRIATGSADVTLKVWDAETGQNVSTFRRSKQWINTFPGLPVAFLPDGETLATLCLNRAENEITYGVEFWDVKSGTAGDVPLEGVNNCGRLLALSPDGSILVTGAWDQQQQADIVRIWDVQTRQLNHVLPAIKSLFVLVLSPDSKFLATGSGHGEGKAEVRVWDAQTGAEVWSQTQPGLEASGIAFSADGRILAGTSWDEAVLLWEVQTGQLVQTLRWPGHQAYSVGFSPDGRTLATGGVGNAASIRLWDWQAAEMQATFVVGTPKVASLAFSPDGRRLVSGVGSETYCGEAQIWDLDRIFKR